MKIFEATVFPERRVRGVVRAKLERVRLITLLASSKTRSTRPRSFQAMGERVARRVFSHLEVSNEE
jgi:hypothetical protein